MHLAQESRVLCAPYICAMMLLDSRLGRSQFRNHSKVHCGMLLYAASMNYWGEAMLAALIFYKRERKGFGGAAPRNYLIICPLLWL